MALLEDMPLITVEEADLRTWGQTWVQEKVIKGRRVSRCFNKKQGMDFGNIFDKQVGKSLAAMMGNVEVVTPGAKALMPNNADVVEVGPVRVIGGIRPQNYDVGYRPDGIRFVFDSKTLNDTKSVGKNFQNMVNDLGTEATTVHTRFPYAVVGFMVIIPAPCFTGETRKRFTRMLDRLVGRNSPIDLTHKAEAMTLVLWDPEQARIDDEWPPPDSRLRIERFSEQVQAQYHERYDGMPPHDKPSRAQREALGVAGEAIAEIVDDEGGEGGSDDNEE